MSKANDGYRIDHTMVEAARAAGEGEVPRPQREELCDARLVRVMLLLMAVFYTRLRRSHSLLLGHYTIIKLIKSPKG